MSTEHNGPILVPGASCTGRAGTTGWRTGWSG